MDYSDRVNSKKGAGGIADRSEANIHTKRRIKELLTTQALDLEKDPYVFRNQLGLLECRLCLTTHTNEASYISHLGGRKHGLNLERRRLLDEKQNPTKEKKGLSMTDVEKRRWNKIGRPDYTIKKVRDPESLRMGFLVQVQLPKITVDEPFYRFMSFYELLQKNQDASKTYLRNNKNANDEDEDLDPSKWQYLVISAEPYDNIVITLPANRQVPDEEGQFLWWYWDEDSKEYFLQVLLQPPLA